MRDGDSRGVHDVEDSENEDEDEEEGDNAGESGNEKRDKSKDKDMWKKPASDHPDWKWVMMWQTWQIMCDWHRRTDYCNPDNFDMYIYNDFYGYGLQELLENLVRLELIDAVLVSLTIEIDRRFQQGS